MQHAYSSFRLAATFHSHGRPTASSVRLCGDAIQIKLLLNEGLHRRRVASVSEMLLGAQGKFHHPLQQLVGGQADEIAQHQLLGVETY